MKRTLTWIMRLWLILTALLVTSCLDVREEFWIHEDGSAKAEISCHMPKAATLALGGPGGVEAMTRKLLEDEGSIDSYEVQVIESGKRVTLQVRCTVDDLLDFDQLRESIQSHKELPPAVRKMVGEFKISIKGLSGISVTRTVAPGEAIPALRWLPKSQTEGHRMVKIMHFPHPIKDHNAKDSWDDGCTLMWESSLANAIQTPLVYHFVMPYPIPWAWVISAGFCVISLVVGVILLVRKRRASRKAS